jgi:putative redox protein
MEQKDVHEVVTEWMEDFHFVSSINQHKIHMDKVEKHGGSDSGPRPKPLILAALGGCMGMEFISIISKMKVAMERLSLTVKAELTAHQPKMYDKIHVLITVKANTAQLERIRRAVNLAWKYCGVVETVKKFAELDYEIEFVS